MAKAIRFGASFDNVRLRPLAIDCAQRLNRVHGSGVVFARGGVRDPRYFSACRANATVLAPDLCLLGTWCSQFKRGGRSVLLYRVELSKHTEQLIFD